MAANLILVSVTVFVFVSYGDGLKLPSYFKPCSRNDPDINKCGLKNGNESFAQLLKKGGDRKFNIPSFTPLAITELRIDQSGLKLTMNNVKIHGLEHSILKSAKIDFKARHEEFDVLVPRVEILSDYSISGRILVLPIHGKGPANMTIPNLKVQYSHDYDLVKGKTGKDHIAIKNALLHIQEVSTGFLHLDNLFGNKELSDQMNVILNDNSAEVIGDVGPAVAEAIGLAIQQIYNGLTALVPLDDFYPEKI